MGGLYCSPIFSEGYIQSKIQKKPNPMKKLVKTVATVSSIVALTFTVIAIVKNLKKDKYRF